MLFEFCLFAFLAILLTIGNLYTEESGACVLCRPLGEASNFTPLQNEVELVLPSKICVQETGQREADVEVACKEEGVSLKN